MVLSGKQSWYYEHTILPKLIYKSKATSISVLSE